MTKNTKKISTKKSSTKSGEKLRKEAIAEVSANIARIEANERGEAPVAATPAANDVQPATKKKSKKSAGTKAMQAKVKAPKKLSGLDAAAKVLVESKEPLTAQDIIKAMADKGLWTSPGGKTPHATIYAAMIREIKEKGKASRFTKVERGMFAAAGKGV